MLARETVAVYYGDCMEHNMITEIRFVHMYSLNGLGLYSLWKVESVRLSSAHRLHGTAFWKVHRFRMFVLVIVEGRLAFSKLLYTITLCTLHVRTCSVW
jgi:hypothetical protein